MRKFLWVIIVLPLFATQCKKDCDRPAPCMEKPEVGPCRAIIPKYYFDEATGKCMEFNWGGCQGNVPFDTMVECEVCECK